MAKVKCPACGEKVKTLVEYMSFAMCNECKRFCEIAQTPIKHIAQVRAGCGKFGFCHLPSGHVGDCKDYLQIQKML